MRFVRVCHPCENEAAVGPVYTPSYPVDARLPLKRPVMVPRSEPDVVCARPYGMPAGSPGLKATNPGPISDAGFCLCRRNGGWWAEEGLRVEVDLMVAVSEGSTVSVCLFSGMARRSDASLGGCVKGLFLWASGLPPSSLPLLSTLCPAPSTIRRLEGILWCMASWSSILCAAGISIENVPLDSSNTGRWEGSAELSEPGGRICEAD